MDIYIYTYTYIYIYIYTLSCGDLPYQRPPAQERLCNLSPCANAEACLSGVMEFTVLKSRRVHVPRSQ